ncbi:MAG: aminoacyl-tRNA hydrolase [Bacteriovoracales bacterium]|nr:aminoacyl-tRNA hydrolase [Bacteriovoracales bacterium]
MVKLVVALGNPGSQYEKTRHNVGWMAMDHLSFASELRWKEKFKGLYSDHNIGGHKVYFLRPLTWMNLSGESVAPMAHFFKISPQEILVVYDEIDLALGTVRFKKGGGLAGHNGLKSTAQMLGGHDFKRLRLGISRPSGGDVSHWVLSPFGRGEESALQDMLERASQGIEYCLVHGFESAASKFNGPHTMASGPKGGES